MCPPGKFYVFGNRNVAEERQFRAWLGGFGLDGADPQIR